MAATTLVFSGKQAARRVRQAAIFLKKIRFYQVAKQRPRLQLWFEGGKLPGRFRQAAFFPKKSRVLSGCRPGDSTTTVVFEGGKSPGHSGKRQLSEKISGPPRDFFQGVLSGCEAATVTTTVFEAARSIRQAATFPNKRRFYQLGLQRLPRLCFRKEAARWVRQAANFLKKIGFYQVGAGGG